MVPLFRKYCKNIQAPVGDENEPFQFRATTLDYNEYVGRIVVGRIAHWKSKISRPSLRTSH